MNPINYNKYSPFPFVDNGKKVILKIVFHRVSIHQRSWWLFDSGIAAEKGMYV
jgi:hypothetical protein